MAAEVGSAPVNGYGHQNTYGAIDQTYGHQNSTSTSTTGYGSAPVASSTPQQSELSKEEVAWYFVESYYTTMSRNPEKLHLFFNKRSQFVSGVEEEKSSIAVGAKAIKDRLTGLNYEDSKVRVTNVDSQGSDSNIVIQVIGEMSNKSQPLRKFVQTFVLAGQTNGYFVLNDIFRYIKDDEEDAEGEVAPTEPEAAATGAQEPAPTAVDSAYGTDSKETVQNEEVVAEVDKKLEEVKDEEESSEAPAAAVNGTPVPESVDADEADEEPAATSAPETKAEDAEEPAASEDLESEKPKAPVPTPAAEPAPAAAPAAPPKPAVPRTWAQLASGNRASSATAAQAARAAPATTQAKQSAPAPASAQPAPATPASSAAIREASPDSNKDGSTGGWQTAGAGHDRKQSRAQNAPTVNQDGRVRAFVKNVTDEVDAEALKSLLSKFGEIVYFDVARQKKAAFVEYKTVAGFQAAVSANPHRIGSEEIWVEERRMPGTFNARGGARGGRGGFDGRPAGRGDFKGTGAPRGSFGGRGRGGSGNVTPRGGRGGPQAA